MERHEDDLAARLAAIHERLDHPPGVVLGVLRLPVLVSILDELEGRVTTIAAAGGDPRVAPGPLVDGVTLELTRLVDLLATNMLGTAPEAVAPRARLIELLRTVDGGRLPALAADDQDPFGEALRAMLDSDESLRAALGRLYPLVIRATSVAPPARWLAEARQLARGPEGTALLEATRRVLAALVRAPLESRPDLLVGGLRPTNQRLARGLVWFASVALPEPAATLGPVGLRMGTSGRSDAVVRDTAIANTCAALLGESSDPNAVTELVSMRATIINRNVLKQVDRALRVVADRSGIGVEELIDAALPTYGLGPGGRLEMTAGPAQAVVTTEPGGAVTTRWHSGDAEPSDKPPDAAFEADPGAVAEVASKVVAIEEALARERRALEHRLGSTRAWPEPMVRRRFVDHPIAGVFARQLIWAIDGDRSGSSSVVRDEDAWIGLDDRIRDVGAVQRLRLWHPADATEGEVAAWRATLAARAIRQPVRQADREAFRPLVGAANADLRFAGRIVDHGRLRALLRDRGWAVPALGAWDQGDEATGWRAFDDGLRAELRYQAPDRVATGDRIVRARLVAVRFVRTDAPAAAPAANPTSLPITAVPARTFSEALRDVSLAVVVGEEGPS